MDDLNSETVPTEVPAESVIVQATGGAGGEAAAGSSLIVQAVGTAVKSVVPGLAARIEAAQVAAVEECFAEGITDSDVIIARKMAATESVLARLSEA
jgi:hypothetical protein